MNDRTRLYLRDALDEALALQDDLGGSNLRQFSQSRHLIRITERSLEIIGEALRRVLDEENDIVTDDVVLRDWVNLRNIISHQYSDLVLEVIWEAATVELPELISTLTALTR